MDKSVDIWKSALRYFILIVFVFISEYLFEYFFRSVVWGSVLAPIYFVRLFVVFYVLISTKYGYLKITELIGYLSQRNSEISVSSTSFSKTARRTAFLLGNSKLHFLALATGFLLYFTISYTSLNPMGQASTGPVVVPIVNGVWGASVLFGSVVIISTELSLLGIEISGKSVELLHEDGFAGFGLVVRSLTRIFELLIVGVGIFFLSFYYFVSYNAIVMIVIAGLVLLFGLYSLFINKFHKVIEEAKKLKLIEINQEIGKLEKMAEEAVGKKNLIGIMGAWIPLSQRRECCTRLRGLKTWPLNIPIVGRLTGIALTSWMLQTAIKMIIELLVMK